MLLPIVECHRVVLTSNVVVVLLPAPDVLLDILRQELS